MGKEKQPRAISPEMARFLAAIAGGQALSGATGRAATFDFALVGTDWARELLQNMERESRKWYVRQAARDALNHMTKMALLAAEQPPPSLSPVAIEQQGWLVEWDARQGIGIGVGRQSMNALMRALEQGQPNVRQAALQTLQNVGDLELHDKLRAILKQHIAALLFLRGRCLPGRHIARDTQPTHGKIEAQSHNRRHHRAARCQIASKKEKGQSQYGCHHKPTSKLTPALVRGFFPTYPQQRCEAAGDKEHQQHQHKATLIVTRATQVLNSGTKPESQAQN
jgi:HEAT repeat protein